MKGILLLNAFKRKALIFRRHITKSNLDCIIQTGNETLSFEFSAFIVI